MNDRLFIEPYADFRDASRAALEYLQARIGMGLWMVTRTSGDDWILLETKNREDRYNAKSGDVLRWSDSFCSRMVLGQGPSFAPVADAVPAYRDAPIAKDLPIGAYIGIPIHTADGELFGTLCAVDPSAQPENLSRHEALIELVARLLATILDRDLRRVVDARRAERAEAAALIDDRTGLFNRRAWEHFRAAEESRCARFGHPAFVLAIDLDELKEINESGGHGAGDDLLRRGAAALRFATRGQDIVARVAGDEFAVLLVECPEDRGVTVVARIREALHNAKAQASIGFARRDPRSNLDHAWAEADRAMYQEKERRKTIG